MKPPSHALAWTILVVEGFVSLSLQVLTIRQLQPFVGNTVVVTSTIIGTFLLCLALGYYKGGQYVGDASARLQRNLLKAGLLIGVGLSYDALQIYFGVMQSNSLWSSLILYLALFICAPVYWLGQTLPLMTSAFKTLSTQQASGLTLTLSTVGSFLGAIITSALLMNWLGTGWTLWINIILLGLLSILLMPHLKTWVASVLIIGTTGLLNSDLHQSLIASTAYAHYQTETVQTNTHGEQIETQNLYISRALASSIDANGKAGPYIEQIKKMIEAKEGTLNILALGAGSFTLSQGSPHRYTYVDIDPIVADIAKQHFDADIGEFIATDARQYVRQTKAEYDVIVLDVYSSGVAIPFHLVTQQFFSDLKGRLTASGTLIMNIIANPNFSDPYSRHLHSTITSVFEYCTRQPLSYLDQATNIIYRCLNQTSPAAIYTDQLNRASLEHTQLTRR